jgi:hypothetical protein
MKIPVEFHPYNIPLEVDPNRTIGVYAVGSLEAMGWVTGPVGEIDMGASYTFEAVIDGQSYR